MTIQAYFRSRVAGTHPLVNRATADTFVGKPYLRHIVGTVNIAQIDDDGFRHFPIEGSELDPFDYDHEGSAARAQA